MDMLEPGGRFSGWPDGRFLYPWQLEQQWNLDIPRPGNEYFTGRHFLLTDDVHYQHNGCSILNSARAGLVSDGGTIRTIFGWLAVSTPFRDYLPAWLIHDQLCEQAKDLQHTDLAEAVKLRLYADRLVYPMLIDSGARKWQARAAYRAVRTGAAWAGLT